MGESLRTQTGRFILTRKTSHYVIFMEVKMADNGNCFKCEARMIVSTSDHGLHVCGNCREETQFELKITQTIEVRVGIDVRSAELLTYHRIKFHRPLTLKDAREFCKGKFTEENQSFEISHVPERRRRDDMQIG
jgi:hypothetical protein